MRSVRRTLVCLFFIKQKTAYEMRISDWSSDVCSSDLEQVLEIGQQQFLMLLFMIEAQFKQVRTALDDQRHRLGDRLVHMRSIGQHLAERGTREHSPPASWVKGAFGLVIAVEQEGPTRIERPIAGKVIAKDEGLEEPAAMGKVPFGRRCVGHRLGCRVRIGKGCHEFETERSYG